MTFHSLNTPSYKWGAMKISKYWIMGGRGGGGGWKKLHIYGRVRHDRRVDLKMGGIHSKVIFTQTHCLKNTQQVYSRTGLKHIFFCNSLFVVSAMIGTNELKISCGVFIFWVSNQKSNVDIGQRPYWMSLFFFTLNYKHWISQSFANAFC